MKDSDKHFHTHTTRFFVNLHPGCCFVADLLDDVNLDILTHFVYNKDTYKEEIDTYDVPEYLPQLQEYKKTDGDSS